MKKKVLMIVFLTITVCAAMVLGIALFKSHSGENALDAAIAPATLDVPANKKQYHASVDLWSSEGKIYCLLPLKSSVPANADSSALYCLESGSIQKLERRKGFPVAYSGEFIYFMKNNLVTDDIDQNIYSYNIAEKQTASLFETDMLLIEDRACYSDEEWTYIPVDEDHTLFCPVRGSAAESPTKYSDSYTLDGKAYFLAYNGVMWDQVCCVEDENQILLELPYGEKNMIPCENGLLIHNEQEGNLLYFIDEDGKLSQLFTVDCMFSNSSVTVSGSDVYLSFERFKEHGSFGMRKYENDELEGTYRISLNDFSAEKLSSAYYDGMYIFDESGIYATAEGSVYYLDHDANVIATILN